MGKITLAQKKNKLKELKNEVSDFHPLLSEILPKIPRIKKVEYTHGQHEKGADFVLLREDDAFGKTEFLGLIVKCGKITQSMAKIEEQIDECDENRYVFNGKQVTRLDEIWIVTNESISEGAKTKIHRKYATRKIHFIQNTDLIHLIDRNYDNFWHDLSVLISAFLVKLNDNIEQYDNSLSLLPTEVSDFYVPQKLKKKERSYKQRKNYKRKTDFDIYEIIKDGNNFIFIEGEPGYGKSKLLREVTKHFCDQDVFAEEVTIPLIISYRDLQTIYKCDIQKLIDSRIDKKIFSHYKDNLKLLLSIDGFDEIHFEDKTEEENLSEILKISKGIHGLQIIIASRPLAFIEKCRSLNNQIAWYELNPLSITGMVSFFKNICKKANISSRIIQDLKKSQIFKQLPKSPIAAILLANLLNENSKELPSNLTELYQKYSELMLGRWDIAKGLQEQKEYDAALSIILNIADFFVEHDITAISINEAETFFVKYLDERNLNIDPHELFKKVTCRSGILQKNQTGNIVYFKHKTFLEFYYANHKIKNYDSQFIDYRVHTTYWRNIYFFYVGLQKDCEQIIEKILSIVPTEPEDKILRILNMADYFLAAFATPYKVVEKNLPKLFVELAEIYESIVKNKIDTPVKEMSEMGILYLFQALSRGFFSYDFFLKGLEAAIIEILSNDKLREETKIYSLYFIFVIFIDLEQENPFDNLIQHFGKELPLQIQLAMDYESENVKQISTILKKQIKKTEKNFKQGSPSIRFYYKTLHATPVKNRQEITE